MRHIIRDHKVWTVLVLAALAIILDYAFNMKETAHAVEVLGVGPAVDRAFGWFIGE